jgi:hypothetical protein
MNTDEPNRNANHIGKEEDGAQADEQLSEDDLTRVTGGAALTFGREKLKIT